MLAATVTFAGARQARKHLLRRKKTHKHSTILKSVFFVFCVFCVLCYSRYMRKNCHKMASFHVDSTDQSKYAAAKTLNCGIQYLNKIKHGETLFSPIFWVQSLPFTVNVTRLTESQTKRSSETEVLRIELVVGKEFESHWSSKFCVKFLVKNASESFVSDKKYENELNPTNSVISHAIEWHRLAKIDDFYFKVEILAGFPNDGYEWPSYDATGYNGLVNEGATCYINSLLQSLFCTNEFRQIIYGVAVEAEDLNESFIFWLKYIFYAMQFCGLPKITTKNLIRCFDWKEMTMTDQQDIQEFLRRLIDNICKSVNSNEIDQLRQMFVGEMKTTTKCKNVDYSTSRTEVFWDIQLSLDESSGIYGAFEKYLEKVTISDYRYDDGINSGVDDAEQELAFTHLPPVLYITLKRFKFNLKSHIPTKNNRKFEFHPKLDLSKYCNGAVYTLHSVLVHSGTVNAGHYTAFICPKFDEQWYKFNDEIVTKCTSEDAIEANHGNGHRTTNAYMLIYMKDSCIDRIQHDVTDDDVASKELIVAEMTKEIEYLAKQDQYIEVTVFTPESFSMHGKYKRGQPFFDPKYAMKKPFVIEKEKTLADLVDLFVKAFGVEDENALGVWYIDTENEWIRYYDKHLKSREVRLKTTFKKRKPFFMVEMLSLEDEVLFEDNKSSEVDTSLEKSTPLHPYDPTKHAMLFIRQFDSSAKSITYVGQRIFMLTDRMKDIHAYIRHLIGFDDDDNKLCILYEIGSGEFKYRHGWIHDENRLIDKIVNEKVDAGFARMATIVFEIVERPEKPPRYLSCCYIPNIKWLDKKTAIKPENTISVTIKLDTNICDDSFVLDFQPDFKLADIVQRLNETYAKSGQLLDAENNLIDKEFYGVTIQHYLDQKNSQGRTRSQKTNKNLVFSYKVFDSHNQSDDIKSNSSGFHSAHDEPMDCDIPSNFDPIDHQKTECIEIPDDDGIFQHPNTSTRSSYNDSIESEDPLKISTHDVEATKKLKILFPSHGSLPNDRKHRQELYLKFTDRARTHSEMELSFTGDENLATAFNQIAEVMDLKISNAEFYNSEGKKITNLDTTVSNFLNNNELNIEYDENDGIYFRYQQTNGCGLIRGMMKLLVDETTTVGDIYYRSRPDRLILLRIRDGMIQSIVPKETRCIDLIDDGYEYRMDQCKPNLQCGDDTFYICLRFIKDSPEQRKRTPLLIEVQNGTTLSALGLIVCNVLNDMTAMNHRQKFDYEIVGDWLGVDRTSLVKPKDPKIIPLVSLNMNIKPRGRTSYGYHVNLD